MANKATAPAKVLKETKVYDVTFDRVRPMTFDFNALLELQEFYPDPLQAMALLDKMNLKAMRAIIYSALKAGAEARGEEFDLTLGQVGSYLTGMFANEEEFAKMFEIIGEASEVFFPETNKETKADTAKNVKAPAVKKTAKK